MCGGQAAQSTGWSWSGNGHNTMSGASAGIGLISGYDFNALVSAQLAFRNSTLLRLQGRSAEFSAEQAAFSDIGVQLGSIQTAASGLTSTLFNTKSASSSNPNLLSVSASSAASTGSWDLLVSRLVSTSQVLSGGVSTQDETALGLTELSFELGQGRLRDDVELAQLNGGFGVERGSILITDRSGTESIVDLSQAATIGEVIDAINASADGVEARLETTGIRLIDTSGGSGIFSARSLAGSNTAEDLGLAQSVNEASIEGRKLWSIAASTALGDLRDGLGIRIQDGGLADITIELSDGTPPISVDLGPIGDTPAATTLAEVQARIEAATNGAVALRVEWDSVPGEITGSIGFGLMLESTTPGVTFDVTGDAAEDLGLAGSSDGSYLVGEQILGGLDGVLLSTLNGGSSFDFSGSFSVTDGAGTSTTVPIFAPTTGVGSIGALMEIMNQQIENQFVSARVELNAQGNGFQIVDTSGFNNIEVTGELADRLGWTAPNRNTNGVATGSSLQRAWVGPATKLSTLAQGRGIGTGTFQITDGLGGNAVVNLDGSEQTVQDLLDEINSKGLALVAEVNATGDGIEFVEQLPDGASSFQPIQVDALSGSAASDLGLVGSASGIGSPLEGRWEYVIDLEPSDTLETLVEKIDASGAPVQAGLVNVGGLAPWRLSLTSEVAGLNGDLVLDLQSDGSAPLFQLDPIQRGQDAKVVFGAGSLGGGFLVTSGSNSLSGVIEGVTIDLLAASDEQTTVTIDRDDSALSEGLQALIDAYNGLRDKVDQYDSYDSESLEKGTLYGNASLRGFVSELTRIVTRDTDGLSGPYRSLQDIGVSIDGEGRLSFDAETFTEALAVDRDGVEALLSTAIEDDGETEDVEVENPAPAVEGIGPRLDTLLENWLSPDGRLQTIKDGITDRLKRNDDSIEALKNRIQAERDRLLREFYVMEQTLARLQGQSNALAGLVILPQASSG